LSHAVDGESWRLRDWRRVAITRSLVVRGIVARGAIVRGATGEKHCCERCNYEDLFEKVHHIVRLVVLMRFAIYIVDPI